MPLTAAQAEIRGSREDLDREIGSSAPIFAYPFGTRDERVVTILREERFEAAVTQQDGPNPFPMADPFGLRRTNITRRTSPIALALRLTSIGARFDAWRHAYPRADRWSFPAPTIDFGWGTRTQDTVPRASRAPPWRDGRP
jgi:peptidoglycan/xylan/chitin deacetylase (PgdA/CDA1 family)